MHFEEFETFCLDDREQVICDTYTPAGMPIPTNKRYRAAEILSDPKVVAEVPW